MPNVIERINVSVDTGGLNAQLDIQIGQISQIADLIGKLINDPPDDLGDLLGLAENLPLPNLSIGGDFAGLINSARGALPVDFGDLTAAVDGNLDSFSALGGQLQEILQDAVRVAAAIEKLTALNFRCGGPQAGSSTGGGGGGAPPPAEQNPAADRMTLAAQQTQQVNDMLDRLPASPTVGGLLEFFFPLIDNKPHNKLFQLTLPLIDDVVEPLRTLSRWAALDAGAIGAEIEVTITLLAQRLRGASRLPLDQMETALNALQPQLNLGALQTFADAYATALNDLVSALQNSSPTAPMVAALNQALDDAATTLAAWEGVLTGAIDSACRQLHDLDDSLLDGTSHLLTLLEPVNLPGQWVSTLPAPQPPSAASIAAVQQAVQPVLDFLNELIGLLDFSSLQGEVTSVAGQAEQIATQIEQGLTGISLQVQSLFDQVESQLQSVDLNQLRDQLDAQLEQFALNIEQRLRAAFGPAQSAISGGVTEIADALNGFSPEEIVNALRQVIQSITGVLQSGEIADALNTIHEAITALTETLEQLSFAPVTDEVVALIEQMTEALRQLQQTDMNDAAKGALAIAMQVLPEDLKPVTDPLLAEFGELIDQGPVPLLEQVAEKPAQLLDAITRFQPGALIGDSLGKPYRDALSKAEAFKPGQLFDQVEQGLQKGKQSLLKEAKPSRALNTLSAPFNELKQEIQRYSPDQLLRPVEQRIEQAVAQIIDASPIDEIFSQVNRVFGLIEQALGIPRNLVATLQRLDTLLGQLSGSGGQIDLWRDGMLDKVAAVTNLSAISAALGDLNSAFADAAHTAILSRYDSFTTALRDALQSYAAEQRINTLSTAHQRARALAQALPDSPDKTALQAALERFNPARAKATRLPAQLQNCLTETRSALSAIQQEWQELVENPQGLLAESAALSASANGLRQLLASAVEPLLSPLRHLFALLESLRPALQAMLSTLSTLVDQLTGGAAALLTGPGSLQSISNAVEQVVDTLRNLDLSFLRQELQQLFLSLLDQLDALDPASLGQELDGRLQQLIDPIGLNQVIDTSAIDALDSAFDSLLADLRDLDPETLVTQVVQPEYDATVQPLVEAFDLTPAFNALIDFLRGLNDELGGELERVNTAYQGLRAARPALDSINVNISL